MKKVNAKNAGIVLPWVFFAFVIIFLSLCFYRDQIRTADYEWFMTWQDDSDLHIRGRIQRTIETSNPFSDYGLIGQYATIDGEYRYDPYFRQMGLQGLYASFVQRITGADLTDTVRYTRMLNALLCAILCAVFSLWCLREFGWLQAALSAAFFAFSPWLTVSARNLYWAMWLMFLPAIITLTLHRREAVLGRYPSASAVILVFLALFLKCGAGYEFVSCVLVCMEIPVVYYAYKNRWSIKRFVLRASALGLGGAAGFATAVLCNLLQCRFLVGSWGRAVQLMMENISKRTGAFGIQQTDDLIIASLNASPITVINTYLFSGQPILFGFSMFDIIVFFLVMLCVHAATSHGSRAAYIASAISIAGPLSWMILAKGHSYIHCHINYVLWSIPTLYCMTLSGTGTLLSLLRSRYKSCGTLAGKIAIIALPAVLMLYIVICFYTRNNVRGW